MWIIVLNCTDLKVKMATLNVSQLSWTILVCWTSWSINFRTAFKSQLRLFLFIFSLWQICPRFYKTLLLGWNHPRFWQDIVLSFHKILEKISAQKNRHTNNWQVTTTEKTLNNRFFHNYFTTIISPKTRARKITINNTFSLHHHLYAIVEQSSLASPSLPPQL